jgi:hypothetical protein
MRLLNFIYKFSIVAGAVFLLLPQAAFAGMSSGSYQVIFDSFNDGGASAGSANYQSGDTLGDMVGNSSASANYQVFQGFPPGLIPDVPSPPPPPPPGGGGGGGGGFTPAPTTVFSGIASPGALIKIYVNGAQVGSAYATAAGTFSVSIPQTGSYSAVLEATDLAGNKSSLIKGVSLPSGGTITGLFLPPTLSLSATDVKIGDKLTASGSAAPNALLSVALKPTAPGAPVVLTAVAQANGDWSVAFNTAGFSEGAFVVEATATLNSESATSAANGIFSKIAAPPPVTPPPPIPPEECSKLIGDLNCDGKVNIQDVSILLAYNKKAVFPAKCDLNHDGKVDLIDFSILLYHWTK